ncbi:ameloblastin isoform 2-T2 [Pelodytes ibericus]
MEELVLVMCLMGVVVSYPMYPPAAGTHGMASVSLESMRNQQVANKLTAFPQLSRFGYNDPYSTLWLHGLLPPHANYPWLHQRPQLLDNQQQAIPTLSPQNGAPADGQIQTVALYMYQTIMNKLLQQGAGETVLDPGAAPPVQQQHPYPGLVFMQYGGAGGPPARLGVMSSEELQAGRVGAAHAFNTMYPGLLGMGSGLGNIPQNPALQGDFTIEDDSPGMGGKPAGQGLAQSPMDNPSAVGSNPPLPGLEGSPTGQGEPVSFPNINLPNFAFNPIGQSKFPPGVTPPNMPQLNHDTGAGFAPFGIEEAMPYGFQREFHINVDTTPPNNPIDTPVLQNDVHLQNHYFQEP